MKRAWTPRSVKRRSPSGIKTGSFPALAQVSGERASSPAGAAGSPSDLSNFFP